MIPLIIELGHGLLLGLSVFELNRVTHIYQCAFFFTVIGIIVNYFNYLYGGGKGFWFLLSIAGLSALFAHNDITIVSLVSLISAMCIQTIVFNHIRDIYYIEDFGTLNKISFMSAIIFDGMFMSAFFITCSDFSGYKIFNIFFQELIHKIGYEFIIITLSLFLLKRLSIKD
jgi:hypothetical protein